MFGVNVCDRRLGQVIPLTERAEGGARNITVEGAGNWTYQLRELSPGATYQLHAFTLLHDKESAAYASRNFTTSECTPGNKTSLCLTLTF